MGIVATRTITLPTDYEQLAELEPVVAEILAGAPTIEDVEIVQYNVVLALHELCVNIIKHAFAGQAGEFEVQLALYDAPYRLEIDTYDSGTRPLDLGGVAEPNLDDPPINGLGIFLMRQLMDAVTYETGAKGNHWRLVKQLPIAAENGSQAQAA